jgi:PAS domain S-box-containing protein
LQGDGGGEENVDPSDLDLNDLHNGASGDDGPTPADGLPGGGDGWWRSVMENSSEIVTVVDPDGTLRYANPAWERALGYDPEQAVGTMNVLDHVHPEDLAHVLEETEEALAKGGVVTNEAEYRFRRKDGSWRWMQSVGTYLLDELKVGGVVVVSRDVTERKEAEERLRFQAQLLGAVGEAVIALDTEGRVLYWNTAAEEMYGWSSEEIMGRRLRDMVVPEDLRGRAEEIAGQLRAGRSWAGEFEVRRRDGTTFSVEGTDTPVFGEDGGLVGVIGVLRDVTERKEAEEALRRNEHYFRSLVQNASDVVTVLEADGTIRYVSHAVEQVTGRRPEEQVGTNAFDSVHPEDRQRALACSPRCSSYPGSTPRWSSGFRTRMAPGATWSTS